MRPASILLAAASFAVGGCSGRERDAVVYDGVLASRSPRIVNDTLFTVLAVDGEPCQRETILPLRDMHPGVVSSPGRHLFHLRAEPNPTRGSLPSGTAAYEADFSGEVAAGHRYIMASEQGQSKLVAAN